MADLKKKPFDPFIYVNGQVKITVKQRMWASQVVIVNKILIKIGETNAEQWPIMLKKPFWKKKKKISSLP